VTEQERGQIVLSLRMRAALLFSGASALLVVGMMHREPFFFAVAAVAGSLGFWAVGRERATAEPERACMFCEKPRSAVAQLIASPRCSICPECAALVVGIADQQRNDGAIAPCARDALFQIAGAPATIMPATRLRAILDAALSLDASPASCVQAFGLAASLGDCEGALAIIARLPAESRTAADQIGAAYQLALLKRADEARALLPDGALGPVDQMGRLFVKLLLATDGGAELHREAQAIFDRGGLPTRLNQMLRSAGAAAAVAAGDATRALTILKGDAPADGFGCLVTGDAQMAGGDGDAARATWKRGLTLACEGGFVARELAARIL
jgi:hypothetical protein